MVRRIKNTVQFKKDVSARNRINGVSAGWHPWSIVEKKEGLDLSGSALCLRIVRHQYGSSIFISGIIMIIKHVYNEFIRGLMYL